MFSMNEENNVLHKENFDTKYVLPQEDIKKFKSF